MKRCILLFICLFGIIEFASAQKTYVVAFDCTKSMNHPSGIYDAEHEDPSVLWIPAKECIHSLWEQAEDEDMFHVILFQSNTLKELHEIKSNLSWSTIEQEMDCAISNGGNTCLYNAWMNASKYFTADCDFYFITDGVEDHDNKPSISKDEQKHIDAICKLIKDFCRGSNRQGFYTNIQESKNDKITNQITETIKSSCFFSIVAGNLEPRYISLDQTDINNHGKDFEFHFNAIDEGQPLNVDGIVAEIICDDYPYLRNASDYFSVSAFDICDGEMTLSIKTTGKDVPLTLLNDNECKFRVRIFSTGKKAIFPQVVNVTARYYIEKVGYLPSDNFKGESNYHPEFFVKQLSQIFPKCDFIAEHEPDTIRFNIKQALNNNALFNDEARKCHSSYKLKLVPTRKKDNNAQFTVLKNGIICPNNIIEVNSSDEELIISIVFSESSAEGKYKFNIVPFNPIQLDKINECANIEEASIPVIIEFDKDLNPLDFWLVCLLCILLTCCLIRILSSHLSRGVYCGVDYVINGSQEVLVKKRRANRIVISSKVKKQNWIDWLFNGKTLYNIEPISELKSDICLEAARLQRTMRVKCQENNDYNIDGSKMRRQILTADENIEHIITDTDNVKLLTLIVF